MARAHLEALEGGAVAALGAGDPRRASALAERALCPGSAPGARPPPSRSVGKPRGG